MTEEFILNTKIEDILKEARVAIISLHDDFTSLPIVEYMCSTLILKLTGLLEQKFRAVIWTLASNNRGYRREFLANSNIFGEYSNYKAKQSVYKILVNEIRKLNDAKFEINHEEHLSVSRSTILELFKNTILHSNMNKDYYSFMENSDIMKQGDATIDPNSSKVIALMPDAKMITLFDKIINLDRNRIAHNTDIVRPVKNDLHLLFTEEDTTRNYFIKFFLLLYIDKVLNQTYERYKILINKTNFFL